jgi:hypothetical protein
LHTLSCKEECQFYYCSPDGSTLQDESYNQGNRHKFRPFAAVTTVVKPVLAILMSCLMKTPGIANYGPSELFCFNSTLSTAASKDGNRLLVIADCEIKYCGIHVRIIIQLPDVCMEFLKNLKILKILEAFQLR